MTRQLNGAAAWADSAIKRAVGNGDRPAGVESFPMFLRTTWMREWVKEVANRLTKDWYKDDRDRRWDRLTIAAFIEAVRDRLNAQGYALLPEAEADPGRVREGRFFMSQNTANLYNQLHARSLSDPEGFWGEVAEEISWIRRWDRVLDDSNPALHQVVQGRRSQHLLQRHRSPCGGRPRRAAGDHPRQPGHEYQCDITYRELRDQVASFAGALRNLAWRRATASSSTCR